jgi:2-succinyl-5-enolpyruvyl-6-hydroxy-3-cyclohexene-1-carboxylate synthase
MTPENLLTEWSRLLFESLADAGLRDVVVSPGSRSTPLVWAALSCTRLRATSVVDERDAGFYALGIARVTGRPAAVLCTSGSAAANYFPAVVEAAMARVPLLVVTADRPFELQDCGASQTLDQTRLYGGHVRRFVDLGMPESEPSALVALRRRAAQSWSDTMRGEPGPVHVNVRARKPLEPSVASSPAGVELRARVTALLGAPVTRVAEGRRVPRDADLEDLAADCVAAERGVIVCGPSAIGAARAGGAIARLARATGFPVYAEATSQLRFDGLSELPDTLALDGLDLLLRAPAFRAGFRPEVVLQIGEAPTSGAWERVLGQLPAVRRHALAAHGHPDPQSTARSLVVADVEEAADRLAAIVAARQDARTGQWATRLALLNRAAWSAAEAVLSGGPAPSEGSAVRAVVEGLPEGALLAIGNSLPVRHLDAFCPARSRPALPVWSQRGVAGIDGIVAGVAGAAAAHGGPTALIVGDVSALHDLGGFAIAAATSVPLVVVVLNNDGGRIFEQLPLSEAGLDERQLRFWTTPHGTRFDGLARLFPLSHVTATTLDELRDALSVGLSRAACTVIEVPVPPHGAREQYRELAARLDAAIAPLLPLPGAG